MNEKTVAVRYFSKGGNTKKLAECIAKAVNCKAESIPASVGETDILFLGAAVYWGGIASEVKDYINTLDSKKVKKVVVFSTSALAQRAFPNIKKRLQEKGICVDEDNFYCRGQFTAMHKGRPNDEDLAAAAKFAKEKVENGDNK